VAISFIFPGQGSQAVGMGKALADAFPIAREVFGEVDDALGRKLTQTMWQGPMEELSLTANTQPALMAHSIAMARVVEAEAGVEFADAMFVAGHSLGEYSALCAAGALTLAQTANLLRIRGEAMQGAVPAGEGAMAALLGIDIEGAQQAIEAVMKGGAPGVCEIANDNAPGQVVISGTKAAVEAVMASAKDHGIKMAKLLQVSAPFHCALMAPAADKMADALAVAGIKSPLTPLVANVTARETSDPDEIRGLLVQQVTGRVRWTESVSHMAARGCDKFVELGAGKILAGLNRRIAKQTQTISLGAPEDIDAFMKF